MPRPPRTTARAKPHSKAAAQARAVAAMDPDVAWADELYARMLADCHPFQRAAVEDPGRRVSLLWGRGCGKTTTQRIRALRKITTRRRASCAYAATSRPEAERLNWEPLKALIEALGEMDSFVFHESKMLCTCKRTGGQYQFFGIDDKREVEKQRGTPRDEFQVDEAASSDDKLLCWLIDRAVGPRMGERNGTFLLGGTPGHILYGRFYEATRPGSELHRPYAERDQYPSWNGWSSHHCNLPMVLAEPGAAERHPALAANWAEALVEKDAQKWSDDNPIWLREYMAKWAADNTTTMYAYDAARNAWNPLGWSATDWTAYFALPFEEQAKRCVEMLKAAVAALPKELTDYQYGYGADLGARDPFALNVRAFSPTDPLRRLFHVACFSRREMYPRAMAQLLIGDEAVAQAVRGEVYTEVGGLFGITGWPAGFVADLAGLGEMVTGEMQSTYGITVKAAAKKDKLGAIEVVNGDLVDERMNVLAGSPLEEQYATLQWKPDEYGQPKEDKAARNDHADSDTYLRTEIGSMFAAPPPKPEKAAPGEDRKRTPKSQATKPKADDWDDRPKKPRGEFDSLLSEDFSGLS